MVVVVDSPNRYRYMNNKYASIFNYPGKPFKWPKGATKWLESRFRPLVELHARRMQNANAKYKIRFSRAPAIKCDTDAKLQHYRLCESIWMSVCRLVCAEWCLMHLHLHLRIAFWFCSASAEMCENDLQKVISGCSWFSHPLSMSFHFCVWVLASWRRQPKICRRNEEESSWWVSRDTFVFQGVAATLCAIYRCVRHTRKSCMPCCTNINNILVKSTNCIRERETADSAPKKLFAIAAKMKINSCTYRH